MGMFSSSQNIDLSASSSSVQSIPLARSPRKWESQDSAESITEAYIPSQISPGQGKGQQYFHPSGAHMQYQMAKSPPQAMGPGNFQTVQQEGGIGGSGGSGGFQQFAGSPQGYYPPPSSSERVRPSSGPQALVEDQGGLWMGGHQQQAQKPNSGPLFQINQHPSQGTHGSFTALCIDEVC